MPTPSAISRRRLLGAALVTPLGLAACTPGNTTGGSTDAAAPPPPPGSATPPPTTAEVSVRVLTDQAYAEPVGRAHLLDLHLPDGAPGPWPVVVFQAGSAFLSDDTKSTTTDLSGGTTAAALAQRWGPLGYAIAGINVRSSYQAHFPAQLHDIKAAIRYLRSRADELGLDTDRMVTMGTSSGAWGAVMAGVVTGVAELEGTELGNADQSSAVSAVVDLFGPTDFLQMDSQRLPQGQLHDPPDSPESLLMGFPIQSDPTATSRADPIRYVSASSPPVWIAHGTDDTNVPHEQSELLFAAYEAAGAPATLTLVPGAGHTDAYLAGSTDEADGTGAAGEICVYSTTADTTDEAQEPAPAPAPTYEAVLAFLQQHLGRS